VSTEAPGGTEAAEPPQRAARPGLHAARGLLVGALYLGAAALGLQIAFSDSNVSLFWLPTGVAVAGLMLWGAPVLAVLGPSVLALHLWLGTPALAAALMTLGICAGYWLASRILIRRGLEPDFRSTEDFRTLGLAAVTGMLLPPTAGIGMLALAGILPPQRMLEGWLGWYAGDVLGVLLAAPLLLALHERWRTGTLPWQPAGRAAASTHDVRRDSYAALAVAALLTLGVALTLTTTSAYGTRGIVAMFVLQLAATAASAWLGLLGAWAALVAVALAVAVPAAMGVGPFVRAQPEEGEWVAWLFLLIATLFVVLTLGARRRLEAVQDTLGLRERQLRAMFEQSNAALSVTERGRYVVVNDAFCAMVGYRREELLGIEGAQITHPDDRPLHAAALRRWAAAGGAGGVLFEKRYLHRDGRVVWSRIAISVIQPAPGALPQVVAVKLDITAHKRVEASLRRQREQLALVFAATGSGIWDHDLVGGRSFHSDSYLEMLGYAPGMEIPRLSDDATRLHPDDRLRFATDEAALFERRVPLDAEYRLRRADGAYLWVSARGFAAWDEAGRAIRSYGAIADISARKAAEAALVDSRARLSAVIDSAIDAIVAIDERGRIVLFNPAAEAMLGHRAADVLGRSLLSMVPARLRDGAVAYLVGLADGTVASRADAGRAAAGSGRTALVALHADGTEFPIDASVAQVDVDAGRLVTLVMRDARQRRRIEAAERARAEAEAASRAKSDFLSKMSHELRTPLNAVLGFAQLMEIDTDAPLGEVQRERVGAIREAGGHLGVLIDELLDLTRIEGDRMRLDREAIDVQAVCRQCLRLLSLAAADARVRLVPPSGEDTRLGMLGDPMRLRQVLVNLLSNAIKYNRPGGTVRLRIGDSGTGTTWIEVEDDGPGIPLDQQSRLFEPFERLGREHGAVEGSGIGLALSRRLVELMEGRIEVDSEPGRGSVFRVRLPSAPLPSTSTAHAAPGRPGSAAERRVPGPV
jgi:PAS domain S-box-containing protein